MKTRILVLFLIISPLLSLAQIAGMPASGYINAQLRTLFSTINPPSPQPQFFYDLAAHFVDSNWYAPNNTDTITTLIWTTLYDEIWFAHYDTTQFERVDSMINRSFKVGADTVVVGLIDYMFVQLNDTALDDTTYFLADTTNNTLYDNPYAPNSPYIYENVFSVAALPEINSYGDLVFRCDSSFFFIDSTRHAGYAKGDLILEMNFDDGTGWHVVNPLSISYFSVQYPNGGTHTLQARVLDKTGTIWYYTNQSNARIASPASETINNAITPNEVWTDIPGMDVEVYWPCQDTNTSLKSEKFIVFAPGFDAIEGKHRGKRYKRYFQNTGMADLRNFGYAILIIDWHDSKDSTVNNALRIPPLIDKLKCNYLDPNSDYQHQFVTMGSSSGAIMMKYALAWMEQNPTFSSCFSNLHHNTRLFISFDAEHQGGNVPLAFQQLYNSAVNNTLPFISPLTSLLFEKQLEILDSPSAKELLLNHYSTNNNGQYGPHQALVDLETSFNALNSNGGYPEHVKTMAVGNGLLTGEHQTGNFDTCIAQAGDLFIGLSAQTEFVALGQTLSATDLSFDMRMVETNEDFLEINANASLWIPMLNFIQVQRCAPIFNWPCIPIFQPQIIWNEVAVLNQTIAYDYTNNVEWDHMPGSRIKIGDDPTNVQPIALGPLVFNFTGLNIYLDQINNSIQTGGCAIHTLSPINYDGIVGSSNTTLQSQTLSFCFVPNFSAFDYQQTGVNQDHNIYSEPTSVKMANTPFDVIVGEVNGLPSYPNQSQAAATFVPWSHPTKDLLYPSLNRGHVRIINH